ncbi:MAG: hypothetical protein CM15mP21_2190 [Hyphomicrobiales bacterium]|nr:MAG: hypothetical protein CM15mP21_2190 [Hyphomicrobiales bacterium]
MSGYQEIITDPSYASQIVAFTFPHIGNVGVNRQILKLQTHQSRGRAGHYCPRARKRSVKFRAQDHLSDWLAAQQIIGISGVDTRAITTPFATMACSMPCWLMRQTANLMRRHWRPS